MAGTQAVYNTHLGFPRRSWFLLLHPGFWSHPFLSLSLSSLRRCWSAIVYGFQRQLSFNVRFWCRARYFEIGAAANLLKESCFPGANWQHVAQRRARPLQRASVRAVASSEDQHSNKAHQFFSIHFGQTQGKERQLCAPNPLLFANRLRGPGVQSKSSLVLPSNSNSN